ncbi:MAG: tripartite tricarboxylate transporter substrate binding protein [Betaproteobacteria bacterium]|nr:tripartite tricarboxylate transporter substrate binding protein [Betaproteobacteria bacterium]
MPPQRIVAWTVPAAIIALGMGAASGQDYPVKPIRLLSPGPGGGADFVARFVAQGISAPLGQQVIVDNRPAGVIPGQVVSKAPPDGYTLLLNGNSFWIAPLMREGIPYDPVKDFSPIALAVSSPNILVVHTSVPAKSVKALIALARARPGVLNYGSASAGGSVHLAAELFKFMAGVDIVRISYKTSGTSVTSLLAGEVDLMFGNAPPVIPHVKSGRLRALAVTTLKPSVLMPGLPTIADSGLPGFEVSSSYAFFAPARTPAAIIGRLNQEIVRFLARADAKKKFLATGVEPVGGAPEQLVATIKSEMTRMGKVIRAAGIRGN